jgi:hypothetical protein
MQLLASRQRPSCQGYGSRRVAGPLSRSVRSSRVASFVWLIVWLVQGTPNLEWFGSWNDWSVALLGCLVFDVFSGRDAAAAGRRRSGRRRASS